VYMDKKYFSLIVLGATGLAGCVANTTTEPKKLISAHAVAEPSPTSTLRAEEPLELKEPDELSLPQALALTLERNPELKSFTHAVRASEARIIQAGLLPNPELSVQFEDMFGPNGGKRYSQATLQLSQIIELGGKRSARRDLASASRDQSSNEYEVKRVEVLASLTDKFIRTTADEHLLQLARKGEKLARQGLENIQKRSQAGGVSELEEAKARVLLARSRIETEHAEHELLSSKRTLATFWGSENPTFSKTSTDLFQSISLPPFDELSARVDQSLEIRKWATEKQLREAERKLAEAKSVSDLTIGAGPRHIETTNDQSFVFQISLPLKVFDRNQGTVQEALISSNRVAIDETAAILRLKAALFGLYQEASHARTQLEVMRKEIIPQAERSLQIAQSGYDQARFSYMDLLDAQRTLLEVSKENIEAAYALHSHVNSIERLLGAPLNSELLTSDKAKQD
jgi:outer membrane protein, heavy metal efflux system